MLVNTTYGEINDSLLEKKEGIFENDDEKTSWVEYWKGDEMVHRSAHVIIKKPAVFADGETAIF